MAARKALVSIAGQIQQLPSGDTLDGASAFVWQGAWDIGTAYVENDVVEHDGSSYIAIANNTGSEPPSADWELMASVGAPGLTGAPGNDGSDGVDASVLTFTATKTGNYNAVVFDYIPCDTSGGSFTVTLPSGAAANDRIGIVLTAFLATTKLTITASGSGASIISGKVPVLSGVSIELFLVGDMVILRHIGGNDWIVESWHITPHHCEVMGSTSAGQVFTHNTTAQATMDNTNYDNAGLADLTNDQIVVRRTGRYSVVAGMGLNNNGTMTRLLVTISVSSGGSRNWSTHPNNTAVILYAFAPFTMTIDAGATVRLNATQLSSDSSTKTAGTAASQAPMIMVQEIL